MTKKLGIDALAVHVPRPYVDLTGEWATVRAPQLGEESAEKLRGKVTAGVGVRKMAVPDGHEDAATMAAMAAKKLIDTYEIDPADLDSLAVGTETTVDQSKSIASYVVGMLERHYGKSLTHVGAPQVQFACIGATYALEAALSHHRAGENRRRYSMVIATDISKYPLRTPGEYTQGAGAVALLIGENPRLLEVAPGVTGTATRDERDFFRPNWSKAAVVDGKYSIDVYLQCLADALAEHQERATLREGADAGRYAAIDHFLFHVPFPRMAEYAAARVFARLGATDAALADALRAVRADLPDAGDVRELERRFAKTPAFKSEFAKKVAPSLALSRDVGNVYSASLYMALASLVEGAIATRDDLAGHRVLLASYGSGASAKVLRAAVAPRWRESASLSRTTADLHTTADGGRRVAIALADYERLHAHQEVTRSAPPALLAKLAGGDPLDAADRAAVLDALRVADSDRVTLIGPAPSLVAPSGEFVLARLGHEANAKITDRGYRYYDYVR